MKIQISKVIDTYLKLRGDKETIEAEAKEKVSKIKEQMSKIEAYIKAVSYTHLTLPTICSV